MNYRSIALLTYLLICMPYGLAAQQTATVIAQNANTNCAIVVADDAHVAERHAANELAAFLKQVTGAEFAITSKRPDGKTGLFVGKAMATSLNQAPLTDTLGEEGFIIKTVDNGILFCGGGPRGTLYAVYTFLEDYAGCRWWSATESTIAQKPSLSVPPLSIRQTPALQFRHPYFRDALNGDWAVRNKCSTRSGRIEEKRAESIIKKNEVHACHTFYQLIPPNTYFKDHPEWFSFIHNRREWRGAQLCLTNDAMRKELLKNLRDRLRKDPAIGIYSVSQNDWGGCCECEHCKALEEKYGGKTGAYLFFVNQVAEAIEEEFPNVLISTFAYRFTRHPPPNIKPRKNVVIRLCSIECDFSVPLSHPRNKSFRDDIIGWSKICKRLYIWDYVVNFGHYVMPHPNLDILDDNIRFFVNHGAIGVMEQGAYNARGTELAELRAWVLAKLLWNPQQDVWHLIREFCDGYYGAGGKHVLAYLQTIHTANQRSGEKIGAFNGYLKSMFNFKTLGECWAHLQAAAEAVKENPTLHARVQVAQLPLLYIVMMRWQTLQIQQRACKTPWPWNASIRKQFEVFMDVVKKNKVTKQAEHRVKGFEKLDAATQNAFFRF